MQDSAHPTLQPRHSTSHHHHHAHRHGQGHHGTNKPQSREHVQPANPLNSLNDALVTTGARHPQPNPTSNSTSHPKVSDASALPTEPTAVAYKNLTFYPAYCFPSSPTFHKWVNITASSIHHDLKPHSHFSQYTTSRGRPNRHAANDGLLLFYLNHPIQFVQVVGVIVAFDHYMEKFWLFTLDDASGSTIDVFCPKPDKDADPTTSASTPPDPNSPTTLLTTLLPVLHLGTTVQVKGTLTIFRKVPQINLKRIFLVSSTAHELAHIRSRNEFFRTTLSIPWTVSERRQRHLLRQADNETVVQSDRDKRRRNRQLAREQREVLDQQLISQQWAEEERAREKDALEAKRAGEALRAGT